MGSGERGDRIAIEIVVVGCGEAFDDAVPNTSLLLRTEQTKILLDCGYSVPPEVWRLEPNVSALDAIFVSHAHADHYFGLPPLLGRMWEEGRTKPLTILARASTIERIESVIALGYRTLRSRLQFPLELRPVQSGHSTTLAGLHLSFADTAHSTPNLAVRVEADGGAVCYSGDGNITDAARALYRGTDLLIHEAFDFGAPEIHASIDAVLSMAAEEQVRRVALVHVRRSLRRQRARLFEAMLAAEVRCILPMPGDVLFV